MVLLEKNMHVLQSSGYILKDSLILFEEIRHLIERCLVSCRDSLCDVFLPSRSIAPSTLWNGSVLMVWIKQCIFTCWKKQYTWSKWRAVFSIKVTFCKGMLAIEKEYSFSLPFLGLGKRPNVETFFMWRPYLRQTLQRGGGTRRCGRGKN